MGDCRQITVGALALVIAGAVALPPAVAQAKPVSAEVARKCKTLRAKQFPPRQIANPAAGSEHGSGQDKREFFQRCVESGGNIVVVPPLQ